MLINLDEKSSNLSWTFLPLATWGKKSLECHFWAPCAKDFPRQGFEIVFLQNIYATDSEPCRIGIWKLLHHKTIPKICEQN